MNPLPLCRHRGKVIDEVFVECTTNHLMFSRSGIAPLAFCARPCPYADRPNWEPETPQAAVDLTCPHRSAEPIRTGKCNLCGYEKGLSFAVFACDLHGECSLHKKHSAVKGCAACTDRPRPE